MKIAALLTAALALALAFPTPARAGNNELDGASIAAGAIGFAAGSLIGYSLSRNNRYDYHYSHAYRPVPHYQTYYHHPRPRFRPEYSYRRVSRFDSWGHGYDNNGRISVSLDYDGPSHSYYRHTYQSPSRSVRIDYGYGASNYQQCRTVPYHGYTVYTQRTVRRGW